MTREAGSHRPSMVYYNEHDAKAAAWLRELIEGGHVAHGYVDERDIRDVLPSDLDGYRQCHFFAGIGGWSLSLRLSGVSDDAEVWTGSCPCQPFSAAGRGGGFADERHLWPAFHHLIRECRPPVVFGEQVASKDGLGWLDLVRADLEGEGYALGAADLCAAGVGAPHIRQRLWWVGIDLGEPGVAHEGFVGDTGREGRGQVRAFAGGRGEGGGTQGLVERPLHERSLRRLAYANGGQRQRLADGEGRLGDGTQAGRIESDREPAARGFSGLMADADDTGSPSRERGELFGADRTEDGRATQQFRGASAERWPRPDHGGWDAPDWLFCRDGKWRPVESGTFPLAHGVPGRVGLLRGYGNAIVPKVAQAFIGAVMQKAGE